MSVAALPDSVEAAVEKIRRATELLIRSAEAAHPDGINEAIEERGHAVERLRLLLEAHEDEVDAALRGRLIESLSGQAQDAATSLRRLQAEVRGELGALARGSRAIHGYAAYSGDPSALDRSG